MVNVRVARRYAEAMVELAEQQHAVDMVANDLEMMRGAIEGSAEFRLFLKSPIIGKARKMEVLKILFGGKIGETVFLFIGLLTEKGREDILLDIINQFFAIRNERQGILDADVRTSVDFSKDQTSQLQSSLESYSKKKVRIKFSVDKQLRGGFVARLGDTVFDGSIKRQLELLRERFVEAAAVH
jgi:F-type H+-transporting ATPase subunit delta